MTTARVAAGMRQLLCGILIATAASFGPASAARAELIATDAVVPSQADSARTELQTLLQREDVRAQLEQLGVDPLEATTRVAHLSDAEVLEVQGHLDELPAGQDFVGLVVGILVVTVTVLLITDLLGFTDVYPFIRPLPRGSAGN